MLFNIYFCVGGKSFRYYKREKYSEDSVVFVLVFIREERDGMEVEVK